MVPLTILMILGVFVLLATAIARVDGLAWMAPKRSARIAGSARCFCEDHCRTADGQCPLARSGLQQEDCPLWRYVDLDLPTVEVGSPFAHLTPTRT